MKFKIGDRVRANCGPFVGRAGEVIDVDERPGQNLPYLVNYDKGSGGDIYWQNDDDLELVAPDPASPPRLVRISVESSCTAADLGKMLSALEAACGGKAVQVEFLTREAT
jgi:hypothetical protein